MSPDALTRRSFLMALMASGVLAACGSDTATPSSTTPASTAGPATTLSDAFVSTPIDGVTPVAHSYDRVKPRHGAPTFAATAADRKLAADLFGLISENETGNFIFSPYSIATAFSMAEAGAENKTEQQMRLALGIESPEARWHAERNALGHLMQAIDPSEDDEALELEIVNTPFGQTDFEFVDAYIQVLAEQYGADLFTVDYRADPEAARQLINVWVADATRDRITTLLPEGSIDEFVKLVLVNTVFFKGKWINKFNPDRTSSELFNRLDGSQTEVPMMHGGLLTSYGKGEGWQTVRLPYFGGYSMRLILPSEGQFDQVAGRVSAGLLEEVRYDWPEYEVKLTMPKFKFNTVTNLIPLFQALGMLDPFDAGSADFSGVTSEEALYISGAFHQATIELDEVGTVATAATAIVEGPESEPDRVELQVDRPFIFVIEHDETGEPLFVGRVLNPNG